MRSCDDIDEQALSYAEIKALCAGDPRIREKMDLDVQVAKLKVLRGDFQNQKYRLEDKLLKTFPEEIQKQKTRIAALQQDSQIAAAHPQDKENFCGMTIKGMVYDDKKAAGERLLLARQEMPNADMMLLGTYRGFELNIRFDSFKNEHQAVLRAELSYPVSLGDDARGNITRLDNAIDNFAETDFADADMLVLPGGMPGTKYLAGYKPLIDLLTDFNNKGKKIAAICAAPSVFSGLGFLKGRKATSYPSFMEVLSKDGAVTSEDSVVVDGNITTSRGLGTAVDFALSLISQLENEEKAKEIAESVVYTR